MSDFLKGNLKLLVLVILSKHSFHGYALLKELEKQYKWKPSCGTLYPVLSGLEKEECIMSSSTIECGRFKKIYTITELGRLKLEELMADFNESMQSLKLNY
ncbi:MAG: PadR family transcriptional regulator [Candidatus Nanoarchaeia archaeon]|nr:PadR family transcriptional regulator [Candidatus Nanoarchaeia archaeon]MDD5054449.1 PadR family transcriptional regulator [Candidatus Nanoarchaeia archaeon]MDD5499416.1 PadR family transcriptional regulator [Candidatus Nanoarchaeia archaeon]